MDDDLLTVRRLLHSGPPSPEATARARDLLTAEMAGAPSAREAVLTPSPRRSWLGRGALLTGGLAALIIAGAIAVPALDGQDHDEPRGGAPAAAPATAQDLLLAAAQRAATVPAATGKYWHVRKLTVAGPIRVGSYDLVGQWLNETWVPAAPGGSSWSGDLQLGYKPRTAADEAAWRAAGSPTSWTIEADTTSGTTTFRSTPGEPILREEKRPVDKPYLPNIGGLDAADLADLPTDPAALSERVKAGLREAAPEARDSMVYGQLGHLLLETPAPPAVRAAAFTAMAGIPGVRPAGTVTGANGRTGTGVELVLNHADGLTSRHLVIIDPRTYEVVGVDNSGVKDGTARPIKASTTVVLAAGWTNTEPAPPKAP